jgi:hypothetical protein
MKALTRRKRELSILYRLYDQVVNERDMWKAIAKGLEIELLKAREPKTPDLTITRVEETSE